MARPWEDEALREDDERFPSGRWNGYWEQRGRLGRMELDMTFGGGRLFGDGRDLVGDFVLSGSYSSAQGQCVFHKAYLGQHGIEYDGWAYVEGILGIWRIMRADGRVESLGVFHIWPVAHGDLNQLTTAASVGDQADR